MKKNYNIKRIRNVLLIMLVSADGMQRAKQKRYCRNRKRLKDISR
jgi:hypothetical protein